MVLKKKDFTRYPPAVVGASSKRIFIVGWPSTDELLKFESADRELIFFNDVPK